MKKSLFLTFIFSLFPGCGQMYQGYMKRGASMLAWFLLILFVSIMLSFGALSVFLVLIWVVSFFDSFNLRALTPEQHAATPDNFFPSPEWLRSHSSAALPKRFNSVKIVGWACIAVGCLMLYSNLVSPFLHDLSARYPQLWYVVRALPAVFIAVVVIFLGIWMLRKQATPPQNSTLPLLEEDNQDDTE